ncbi:MAG TPA: hypothetical protein VMC86_02250 [Gemmatimonadales bacterium]|nr:hypothetical protein [Gemmatimonadales bacterium]
MRAVTPVILLLGIVACGGSPRAATPPAPAPVRAPVPPARVLLRYHPRPGDRYNVVAEQVTETSNDSGTVPVPASALKIRTFSHDSVLPPAGDTVRIRQVIDSIVPSDSGEAASLIASRMGEARGANGLLSLDDRMSMRSASFSDRDGNSTALTASLAEATRRFAIPLPDGMVAPGDTWSTTVDAGFSKMLPGMDSVSLKSWFRVDSILLTGADTSVRLAVRITFPTNPINMTTGGLRLAMFMTGDVTGTQWFSVTRGVLTRAALGGTIHISAASPALGAETLKLKVIQHTSREVVP